MSIKYRAYAEVDLTKIRANLDVIKNKLAPQTAIMAIVKADGYGHGAIPVARVAMSAGASYLGVAWLKEAEELRLAQIETPILLLSEPPIDTIAEIIKLNLTQAVYSKEFVIALNDIAQQANKIVKVHVKIDTGMGRIGLSPEDSLELIILIKQLANLDLEGVFTHFACADEPQNTYNQLQQLKLNTIIELVKKQKIKIALWHVANSALTTNFPELQLNLVRIGISMYHNALSFKSRIGFIKEVPANTSISYGATYQTKQQTRLATVSVGYADGYPRRLSNQGEVIIHGKKYPVVGNVCMDMLMIDIGNDQVKIDDEVILIGEQHGQKISAKEVADRAGLINYEILCGIGKRVPRVYVQN